MCWINGQWSPCPDFPSHVPMFDGLPLTSFPPAPAPALRLDPNFLPTVPSSTDITSLRPEPLLLQYPQLERDSSILPTPHNTALHQPPPIWLYPSPPNHVDTPPRPRGPSPSPTATLPPLTPFTVHPYASPTHLRPFDRVGGHLASTSSPVHAPGPSNPGNYNLNFQPNFSWELRATGVPKKSRIETQVKLNLELNDVSATASSGAGSDARLTPEDGVPVKQYSYIRVPRTASVKTKTKGICDPNTSTVLTLTAKIYCASNPHHEVPCCVDCQKRERKRNIKKATTSSSAKASRSATNSKNATPATSDVEAYGAGSHWGQNPSSKDGSSPDGYVSPIDFTCSPLLDFASGNAALSFRIVCYCRHHKEKVGFCVRLTLQDNFGRVVGEVVTTPIMITDDHKSVPKLTPAHTADEEDGDSYGISTKRRAKRVLAKYSESEGRIKQEEVDDADDAGVGAIRNKHRLARKSNALSRSATGISRLTTTSAASTSAPLPITTTTNIYSREPPIPGHRSSHSYATHSESPLATTAPSSPSAGFSPPPPVSGTVGEMDGVVNSLASMPLFSPTAPSFQPQVDGMSGMMNATIPGLTNTLQPSPPPPSIPCPLITKVIPGSGPILGGIEVTLLGANFSREMLASAIIAFGENYVTFAGSDATTTIIEGGSVGTGAQVWSETVIICTLPPSAVPGPVEVKLLGVPTPPNQMDMGPVPGPIFVYTDENERDLMIMALQTLGWQNSGQWQDARSVAMHILGPQNQAMGGMMGMQDVAGSDISSILGGGFNYSNRSNMHARNPASGSSRNPAQGSKNVEDVVLRVLRSAQHPVTGAISQISTPHPVTGQTLLHLAAALGFSKLVVALIGWKANVQIPDKNGFSPVHFACFYGKTECVDLLVRVGRAHLEGRDCRGRMPLDICGTEEVRELVSELEEEVETRRRKSRIGSEIESGGEGDDEGLSWSEAEDDDEDEDRRPAAVSGAKAPQSVTKRISRANSAASIASHKAISRVATPFRPDDSLNTMTPIHPNPVPPLAPPSPTSSWGLGRNISMPWPAAGWQFPNVPAMPQFGQRRRHGQKGGLEEADAREESEQMFKWMMWMDSARKMWQAQQQQQPATELDVDPPPMYSPTGATSLQAPLREKDASSAVGTPAAPTTLEEPPSPLSLDSPYSTGTAVAGPSNVYTYHRSHHAQASLSEDPSNTFITTPTVPSSETKVVRRKTKTRDTMLIYFWIPVLILVIMGASYKSFMALSRFLVPNKVHPGMQDVHHRAIEL
ncbi:hypothetical protein M408DRAFT_28061 [Serendipita vermifera MAFF 305830]|uniref:Uncharacterized protein n=1 Tax=Serendipita vermifera MAFF 305830 TaxID=933852 RepID=A0A0C3AVI2_SERVB|nr:hypothetical protein M408DRAFT_28061 [Serendipita vermifera MAFF 305830]